MRWLLACCGALAGVMAPASLMLTPVAAHAAVLEGQRFDPTVQLGDRTLRLNGLGLRGVAWVKAFVTGLYLPATTRDPAAALAMPGPKRLQIKVLLEAPAAELSKSLNRRVKRHEPAAVQQRLSARLSRLTADINGMGTLKPGDVIELDYVPDQGVGLRHNGKAVGTPQPGEDLYRAVLKVFIGEHPIDQRMKDGLMRGGV
ncbi:hypothetical protein GTZ97_15230 [Aquabacterium fontiphilum]|jgi:flagellar motor switch/type III secretory pathway protein FliN|uniref:chalcone isomerase family protein n=1 Tax=Aquabacterium fontiphilum TaxID=450365 RepID=UPI001378FBD0|nr:chalcone isomerase family protein [Aquabacterium fontiphilum]NBD22011.1 hypothetical protein [Aquabacterium fontiphilum]